MPPKKPPFRYQGFQNKIEEERRTLRNALESEYEKSGYNHKTTNSKLFVKQSNLRIQLEILYNRRRKNKDVWSL